MLGGDARLASQPASPPDVAIRPDAIAYHTYKHTEPGVSEAAPAPRALQLSHGCLSRIANWSAHAYRLCRTDVSLVVLELGSPLFLAQVTFTCLYALLCVALCVLCVPLPACGD